MKYRTVFISDTHLGFSGCRVKELHDFIKNIECDTLYLVGDIFDLWYRKWTKKHRKVIELVLKKAHNGTKVIFIPGNHDAALRDLCGIRVKDIHIVEEAVYESVDGERFLVLHGDRFDSELLKDNFFIQKIGCFFYDVLLQLSKVVNRIREILGKEHWSLSSYVKSKTKRALSYIARYEEAIIDHCDKNHYDGVICGHIHHAEIREMEIENKKIVYMNCGDWVESLTAICEDKDGNFELVRYRSTN